MLNKLKQLASFLNLPVLVLSVSFTVLCFVIIKFLHAYIFPKSSKKNKHGSLVSKDREGNVKSLSRKKKNKKRSVEIATEHVPKSNAAPVNEKVVVDSNKTKLHQKSKTPAVDVENINQVNKKQDKKKSFESLKKLVDSDLRNVRNKNMGKSKKKKVSSNDIEVITPSISVADVQSVVEEGEWQTVRSKDQKMQRKEKRRQDESVPSTAPIKTNIITPYTPTFNTSIPSTAKDVAPRFARAAGEEWQEGASKRQSVNVTKSTTIVNRSPMLPAAAQQQPQSSPNKWATVTSAPLPDIWENKPTTSTVFSSPQHTWSSNKSSTIPWTTSTQIKPAGWAQKPAAPAWEATGNNKTPANINSYRRSETKLLQFGDISPSSVKDDDHFVFRTPYTRGPPGDAISTRKQHLPSTNLTDMLPYAEKTIWNPALDQDWHGDAKSDDWVHVTTPSPTSAPLGETWATAADVYQQTMHQWSDVSIRENSASNAIQNQPPKERFHMEPEGLSVSSLDPEDPWNMDTYEKEGDWSPPEATWSNSHAEWTAPSPATKPQPTYFDESSEEEKVITSTTLQPASAPQTVVGAGSELLQEAQNQQTNKKARRRRKKKQTSDVINDATSKVSVTVSSTIEETKVQPPKTSGTANAIDENQANDNWSVPKQSKKKKPRARKAE